MTISLTAMTTWTKAKAERRGWLTSLLDGLCLWIERDRQRSDLLELNDHLLKDIGISRADAQREGAKHFWER